MTLPDNVRAAVHLALEKSGGDRYVAAGLLGWDYQKLANTIYACNDLRARWTGKAEAPTEVSSLTDQGNVVDLPGSPDVAAAIAADDAKLRKGLEKMGLNEEEQKFAEGLQSFQRDHFKSGLEMSGAGLTRLNIKFLVEIDNIQKRLRLVRSVIADLDTLQSPERGFWVAEEASLVKAEIGIAQEISRQTKLMNENALQVAILYKNAKKERKPRKPGFSSPVVDLEP